MSTNNSGLCSIVVKGQEIGLRFGMPANRMILEKLSENPSMLNGDLINEDGLSWVLFAGYVNHCMVKDVTPKYDRGYFIEFVEDCQVEEGGVSVLQMVAKTYADSKYTLKSVKSLEEATADIKKKTAMIGTK